MNRFAALYLHGNMLLRRALRRGLRFRGRYADWQQARAASQGYDSDGILARVRAATDDVIGGRAAFDRDGVLFEAPSYPFHLIAILLRAAQEDHGRLSVLDFGGALGSSYRQCQNFLPTDTHWMVVEQENFASIGRTSYTTEQLAFYSDIGELPADHPVNVALFSSVIQYLPDPWSILTQAGDTGARYLIIDRVPLLWQGVHHEIAVQEVPESIYRASYPIWLFSKERLMEFVQPTWILVCAFDSAEGSFATDRGVTFGFQGLIFRRRDD